MAAPDGSPVIRGTGGLRKLRFATPDSNRGKRGSYRVFYVYFPDFGTVLLMAIIAKSDESDLTKADRNALAQVINGIQSALERGAIR
jgi:hypothetical protein